MEIYLPLPVDDDSLLIRFNTKDIPRNVFQDKFIQNRPYGRYSFHFQVFGFWLMVVEPVPVYFSLVE